MQDSLGIPPDLDSPAPPKRSRPLDPSEGVIGGSHIPKATFVEKLKSNSKSKNVKEVNLSLENIKDLESHDITDTSMDNTGTNQIIHGEWIVARKKIKAPMKGKATYKPTMLGPMRNRFENLE
ncbi:hypothetical protein ACFE04_011377 [Oxalis oulophora]